MEKIKTSFVLFGLLIASSALPHGLEIEWQFLLFSSLIFIVALTKISFTLYSNKDVLSIKNNLVIYLALFLPWITFTALQLQGIIDIRLSDFHNTYYLLPHSANLLGTISIHESKVELLKYTTYLTVFGSCYLLINNKEKLLLLCRILFGVSFLIALYSIYNHFTNGSLDLIESIPPWTIEWDKATHGTFSYQNHYAAFLNLTIPLGVGLVIENSRRVNKKFSQNRLSILLSPFRFYFVSLSVMYIALILTSSRGGNAIFIFGICITAILVLLLERNKNIKEKLIKLFKYCLLSFVFCAVIFTSGIADSLVKRLSDRGFEPNGRDLMRQTAYQIIEQHPLYGTGAGTYPLIQHKYKSPELGTSEMSKRAHNDYLELLANQGIVGFTLLALPILYLLYSIFRSLGRNRESSLYGVKAASFCSIITVLMHSMADFNFQLPAIAIYFFAIMAIALKCDQVSKNKRTKI